MQVKITVSNVVTRVGHFFMESRDMNMQEFEAAALQRIADKSAQITWDTEAYESEVELINSQLTDYKVPHQDITP